MSKSLVVCRSKTVGSDAAENEHLPGKNQPYMLAMISKLWRQQAAPDVDTDIFNSDPVDHLCFIAVFDEMGDKKIDVPQRRVTRFIKYTDSDPKEMIKQCIQ